MIMSRHELQDVKRTSEEAMHCVACEDGSNVVDPNEVLLAAVLGTESIFNKCLRALLSQPHRRQERRAFIDAVSQLKGQRHASSQFEDLLCVLFVSFHQLYAALHSGGLSPDVQEMAPKMLEVMGEAMRSAIQEQQEKRKGWQEDTEQEEQELLSESADLPPVSLLLDELQKFNELLDQSPPRLQWPPAHKMNEQMDMLMDIEEGIEKGTCTFARQLPNLAEFAQEAISVELAKISHRY